LSQVRTELFEKGIPSATDGDVLEHEGGAPHSPLRSYVFGGFGTTHRDRLPRAKSNETTLAEAERPGFLGWIKQAGHSTDWKFSAREFSELLLENFRLGGIDLLHGAQGDYFSS